MLLVRTKVFTSQIHSIGCFACDAIKLGTIVWQLHPLIDIVFSAAEILAMPQAFQIFLTQYASKDVGQDRYVFCTDNARFINHATSPNLTHSSPTSADKMFANRDIIAGEELTLDYQFVDDPNEPGNILTQIALAFGGLDDLDPRIKIKCTGPSLLQRDFN